MILLNLFAGIFFAAGAPLCEKCNVVVIALDATQGNHVSHLGYARKTTPNLDALAKSGVTFTQAISPASWTVPTYLSVFSSMYPSEHGLTNRYVKFTKDQKDLANFKKREPEIFTLAQIFKDNGYRTGGFTGDSGLSAVLGYDKGFEVYTDETQFGGLENSSSKALDWIAKEDKRPTFLLVHGYDSHGQFKIPKDYKSPFWSGDKKVKFSGTIEEQAELREKGLRGEKLELTPDEIEFWRSWYDGKIADADRRLQDLIERLGKQIPLEKTVLVVFADHGTEFAEHGRFDHGHSLYDELIHVPFVIKVPGLKKPQRITHQVSTMDLLPTLVELTGLKTPEALKSQVKGTSLVGLMEGKSQKGHDVFVETDYRNATHKRAIRTADGWKYLMTLENGTEELYNLRTDPRETKNLMGTQKAKGEALKAILQKHIDKLPPTQSTAACLPAYPGQCDRYL